MEAELKKINDKIQGVEERVEKIERLIQGNTNISSVVKKKISAKEFLLAKAPKSVTETSFYLGYFLEKIELMDSFTVEDLKNVFRLARTPLPKNINDLINKNIVKRYFMEAQLKGKGQKKWMLTALGEKHAEGERSNG